MANKIHNPAVYGLLAFVLSYCTTLQAKPQALFLATSTSGCNPLKVDFINNSKSAVKYLWTFGNGNSSSLQMPSAVFNKPGKYSICLIATDAGGIADTLTLKDYITVFQSPVADFTANKSGLCAGDSVKFTEKVILGDAPIGQYRWDFGNGQIGYGGKSMCTYGYGGDFDVALAITDTNGCAALKKLPKYIHVSHLPVIEILSENRFQCQAPASVNLSAHVTGNAPFSFHWKAGDGDSSVNPKWTHLFNVEGKFNVQLEIVDANGCKNSSVEKDFVIVQSPKVDFVAANTGICKGAQISFVNQSSPRNGTGRFHWDFGNGDTSNIENPNWTFQSAGLFDVTLTYFWNNCIVVEKKTGYIDVKQTPWGKIAPHDTTICRSARGKLMLRTQGAGYSKVEWSMGVSNLLETKANGVFLFPADTTNGTYTVKAVFHSPYGCGTAEDNIKITVQGPYADMCLSQSGGCMPYSGTATFCGSSQSPIASYNWLGFGKNTSQNKSSIQYTNNTFGITPLRLIVTDVYGCSHEKLSFMGAGIKVDSKFPTDKKVICNNEVITLYNHSKQQDPDTVAYFYSWFGKDTIPLAYGDSVKIRFRTEPSPNVKLSVTASSYGCAAQYVTNIEVLGPWVQGSIHAFCDRDSFRGINNSIDFTSSYWVYTSGKGKRTEDPVTLLVKKLDEIRNPWIYAENTKNNCKDSIPLLLNIDPQTAAFTYELKCGTGFIKTKNLYQGLHDTFFTWTLRHKTSGSITKYRSRDVTLNLANSGEYELTLNALNKKYLCTKPQTVTFYISPSVDNKAKVTVDRISCYPVKMKLEDPLYSEWVSASWKVGSSMEFKDSSPSIALEFISNQKKLPVFLTKTDKQGCRFTDSFMFDVNGSMAAISMSQNHTNCLMPVCEFSAQNSNPDPKVKYNYIWDFGFKKSFGQTDTVKLIKSKTIYAELSIVDSKGCISKDKQSFDVKIGKPKAKFVVTSDTLTACPPLQVRFADSSSSEYGPITMRNWNFGDGSNSDKPEPGKLYVAPGNYPVSIEVANASGCRDTFIIPDLVVVKGPMGVYTTDKLKGCVPFHVNLIAKDVSNVSNYSFDMGDGNVIDITSKNHEYSKPGMYIPRLILTDSNGCKYSPVPKDTIMAYDVPKVKLSDGVVCKNEHLTLVPELNCTEEIDKYEWFVDNKKIASEKNLDMQFGSQDQYHIQLNAITAHQCSGSAVSLYKTFGVSAGLSKPKDEFCLGEKVVFKERNTSDTTIFSKVLKINNEDISSVGENYMYNTHTRGQLKMSFVVTDVLGCADSISDSFWLKVGDTIPPPLLTIYRSTVVDNSSTQTLFAPTVECDYKNHALYLFQNGYWKVAAQGKNQADTNLIANGLNTLKNSYCHIVRQQNFCGKISDTAFVVPHCTIETKAVGDTNVSRVSWSSYSGWKQIDKYRIWRKEKSEDVFLLRDSVAGTVTQYTDSLVFCNIEYDYRIEGVEWGNFHQNSYSDTARSKPIHVSNVPAPELWRTTVSNNAFTHTEWIMKQTLQYPISYYQVEREQDGLIQKVYGSHLDFDDYHTNVQASNYTYKITAVDVCNGASAPSNLGRSILLDVTKADEEQNAKLNWTPYIYWNEGVQEYRVERSISDGEFMLLGVTDSGHTEYIDKNLPVTCEKNIKYRVTAIRSQPEAFDSVHYAESVSNEAMYTPDIRFFIPNAFTPDGNQLNEGFHPTGAFYSGYEMKIYNRYGQKVYDNNVCSNAWDGRYMDEQAQEGIYAYYITAFDMAGKSYQFNGTITLLR